MSLRRTDLIRYFLSRYFSYILYFGILQILLIYTSHNIGFIDSGELSTSCYMLGICHPTGYPVFTVMNHFFLLFLPLDRIVGRGNLISTFLIAGAGILFIKIIFSIINEQNFQKINLYRFISEVLPIFSLLIFCFSEISFSAAINIEVHALQIFLYCLLVWILLKVYRTHKQNQFLFLSSFIFGLLLSNHLTGLLFFPAFFFAHFWFSRKSNLIKYFILNFLFFISGLSMYLYLPIRSFKQPLLDWGNPESFLNFYRHVTGWQFQVWLFKSLDNYIQNLSGFLFNLPIQTGYWIVFFPIGIVFLYQNKRFILYFLLLMLLNMFYVSGYQIHDLYPYYFQSFLSFLIISSSGLFYFQSRYLNRIFLRFAFLLIIIITSLFPFYSNMKNYNQNINRAPEIYTKQILNSLPLNTLIMTRQWDYFYSPYLYLKFVENFRSDIIAIDRELLRRSWYFHEIRRIYPHLLDPAEKDVQKFLTDLRPFEENKPYNAIQLQREFHLIIFTLLTKSCTYSSITPELLDEPESFKNLKLFPEPYYLMIGTPNPLPKMTADFYLPFHSAEITISKQPLIKNLISICYQRNFSRLALHKKRIGQFEDAAFWSRLTEKCRRFITTKD